MFNLIQDNELCVHIIKSDDKRAGWGSCNIKGESSNLPYKEMWGLMSEDIAVEFEGSIKEVKQDGQTIYFGKLVLCS